MLFYSVFLILMMGVGGGKGRGKCQMDTPAGIDLHPSHNPASESLASSTIPQTPHAHLILTNTELRCVHNTM